MNTFFVTTLILITIFFSTLTLTWRSRNLKLLRLVESKTDELRHSLLRLEASETELKSNLEFRQRIIHILIHDIRSPLNFIHKLAQNLQSEYSNLSKKEFQELTNELSISTYQISEFISDMLQWINANQQYFKPINSTFVLDHFFVEDCKMYLEIAKKKGLSVDIKCSKEFQLNLDKQLFKIIIRNILDNAIKNTVSGKITLNGYSDSLNHSNQIIVITDTGVGMSKEKIFEIEKGVITRKSNDSSQIGFRIIYDLLKKLNGSVAIQSVPNCGTTVTLTFPSMY